MSLRDILIFLVVFGGLPFILKRPHVGILFWSWLSYMNPHRLTWGFAYSMPFAQIVLAATLLSMIVSKDRGKISSVPRNSLTVFWFLFLAWMGLTTLFALDTDSANTQLVKVGKVQISTFMTILLINNREKLEKLMWVICLSIGYFTIKGGVFTIKTAGAFMVWGPPGSYIEDNNALAVTSVMLIPLMFYLRSTLQLAWARNAMIIAIALTAVSAAGSYSRSAFVAGACTALFLITKVRRRGVMLVGLVLIIPLIFTFMPESWHQRMETITNPTEEGSAMNRLEAWQTAINVANDRFLGGGFNLWSRSIYAAYGPSWIRGEPSGRNAHSIYFNVLAEHGWIGFALFLLILILAWRRASYVVKRSRNDPELTWAGDLARMIQVSLIAYASGGATLTLSYFDLPWHLFASILILSRHVDAHGKPPDAKVWTVGLHNSSGLNRPGFPEAPNFERMEP